MQLNKLPGKFFCMEQADIKVFFHLTYSFTKHMWWPNGSYGRFTLYSPQPPFVKWLITWYL